MLPLLAVLGGCGALSTSVGSGGPVVAGHLGYVKNYTEAGSQEKARVIRELEDRLAGDDARTRLRYAIVLSLHDDSPEALVESLDMLSELQTAKALTPAERWLAGLWRREVVSRLDLTRENADVRVALEQAERKLQELTRIEEQLEAQDNGAGEQ